MAKAQIPSEQISFLATLPDIQSAIKVGNLGMRLTIDVPESELWSAVKLIALRDKVLRITVEVMPDPIALHHDEVRKRGIEQ